MVVIKRNVKPHNHLTVILQKKNHYIPNLVVCLFFNLIMKNYFFFFSDS